MLHVKRLCWIRIGLCICVAVFWFMSYMGQKGEKTSMVVTGRLGVGYMFEHGVSMTHYVADAFVLRCFDHRFRESVDRFLKSLRFD